MKTKEILEGNKLIAEFMELEFISTCFVLINSSQRIHKRNLKYNSSWDWLMPVVEKIAKINGCHVLMNPSELAQKTAWVSIEGNKTNSSKKQFHLHKKKLIDATYECIVLFIKWYNETNNK
jgi:hypothetical protein